MFGRPPPAAPQKDWSEMYFHQKTMHLIDHAADWMFAKTNYWVPSVAVGMIASIFFLSGPMAIPEAMSLITPVLSPAIAPPLFGNQMPEREGGMGGEDEEEEE